MKLTKAHAARPNSAPSSRTRGGLGRAELLLALELGQNLKFCTPAPDAEYVELQPSPALEPELRLHPSAEPVAVTESSTLPTAAKRWPMQWLWLLSEQHTLADVAPSQAPETLPDLPGVSAAAVEQAYDAAEAPATRSGWRQLQTQLQAMLSASQGRRKPDWPAACARLARGLPLWPLPLKRARKWPGSIVVIEDARSDLALYAGEWQALRTRLQKAAGKAGVRHHLLRHATAPMPAVPHGQSALLLSDALCAGGDDALAQWAQRVRRYGYPLLAWHPADWPAGTASAKPVGAPLRSSDPRLQQLVALVYLLRYVEDALLRCLAVRLLPGWGALSLIHALQRHPALSRSYSGYAITTEALADPEFRLQMEASLKAIAPETLHGILEDWRLLHAVLAEVDRLSPALRFPALLPQLSDQTAALNAHARHLLLHTLPEAMRQAATARPAALSAWRAAKLLASSCGPAEQIALSGLYHQARQALGGAVEGTDTLPSGLHPGEQETAGVDWQLRQIGNNVCLEAAGETPISVPKLAALPLAHASLIQLETRNSHRDLRLGSTMLPLADAGRMADEAAPQLPQLKLRTSRHHLRLAAIPRPRWAIGWGRDRNGAFVLAPSLAGKPHRFEIPEGEGLDPEHPLLRHGQEERFEALPDTRLGLGVDRLGLFATVQVKQSSQRLRWLPPGEFWMGSRESEPGFDWERPQHLVRFTEGFWLADTACTQAFWLAVVGGENPSRFQDDPLLPVEQVSWDDINGRFLPRLQALLGAGVQAQLPSEAEWEYACRAGTTTPFWFGETITPELVNFDGRFPYGKGKKGLFRGRTVPVASLPANDWGFYEMHGNVWEWCRDGMRAYDSELVTDPEGPQDEASLRVLHGGSWLCVAVLPRSACRYAIPPGRRDDDVGFRFGLRSLSPVQGRPEGSQQSGPDGPQRADARSALAEQAPKKKWWRRLLR